MTQLPGLSQLRPWALGLERDGRACVARIVWAHRVRTSPERVANDGATAHCCLTEPEVSHPWGTSGLLLGSGLLLIN